MARAAAGLRAAAAPGNRTVLELRQWYRCVAARGFAMPTVFDKLNLKDQREILVLNAPQEFETTLRGLRGVTVKRTIEDVDSYGFALGFATRRAELDRIAKALCAKAA